LPQAADFNMNATAANHGLPSAAEHLDGENVRRAENAFARLLFCPLQGIAFIIAFSAFRCPSGIAD